MDTFIDLSDRESKRKLLAAIGAMQGLHDVVITPRRPTRSAAQNRYYWSVVVESLRLFLAEQGEPLTKEECHRLIGAKFLRKSIVNQNTGEIVGETILSTSGLDVAAFSAYIEAAVAWLADTFGIVVPDPPSLENTCGKRRLVATGVADSTNQATQEN